MLYKYNVILDINPMVDKYDEVKGKMDNTAGEFGCTYSSLSEMGIKEQLKYYIDKVRMFELIDKL